MIHAEVKGKLSERNAERSEDILTSNVFSFFQYADRRVFLYELLRSWGLRVTEEDARAAQFRFWPQFPDGTEPDLVIEVGDYYLLIEAKYRSGFGLATSTSKDQLTREKEGGTDEADRMGKRFKLVAVTAHHFHGQVLDQIPEDVRPFLHWTNWQQMTLLIRHLLERGMALTPETTAFAEDLYDLLLRKGLRAFAGLTILEHYAGGIEHSEGVFFDARTATHRGSFLGFLTSLELEPGLVQPRDRIFFRPAGLFVFREMAHTIKPLDSPIFYGARKPLFAALYGAEAEILPQDESIFMGRER